MEMEEAQAMLPGLWHWPPRWEEESQPSVNDLALVPFFAVLFPLVRVFLDRFIFERMGRKLIAGFAEEDLAKMSEDEREEKEKKLIKFKESAWKCVYYTAAEMLALAVTFDEPWFTDTKWFYLGPGNQIWPHLSAKLKLKVLYAFSGGFYTYSIFALCFWETRRKDFGVSMTHHVGTLALIIVSYTVNLQRAGSVILAVHDASDVFLEIGKLTKYSGLNYVPEIAFGLFAISWLLLRLLYFPIVIIKSTTYQVLQVLDKRKHPNGPYLYYILNTLLICLLVLHVYWWILIWRMIMRQIQNSGKISEDVRSGAPLIPVKRWHHFY
ncbi:hypothetical protein M758_11G165300 [Ceratodon purpureus]|uniref:TLC domain-containing protein n=1 Tax=Ceratodon purpureus TaxID=3225 RepID=A0A8T0GG46_CERPU|nr:hypothetical protein KC19_11G169900 [Ceratodon purpureus]KAG0602179.1 hypothetical protein M758_11G165300 [Ceratodon purpureus]